MPRAVALFSGGLDSTLAILVLKRQGFEIDALNVRTPMDCCRVPAARAAAELGVRLTVRPVEEDYVDVIRRPRFGYGRAMNPCVDCRIYMARMARRLMDQVGACVVATGEVLGQRVNSQKRRQLTAIEVHSGLEGRLLRPLSARLLPPTVPEREGLIDRERLYGFSGRGRRPLIALARRLGVETIPGPSTGCALTERSFAPRVRDLMEMNPAATLADYELLNLGRHVRFDERTKVVVSRNGAENSRLRAMLERSSSPRWALVAPDGFPGPFAIVAGEVSPAACTFAAGLIARYGSPPEDAGAVLVEHDGTTQALPLSPAAELAAEGGSPP